MARSKPQLGKTKGGGNMFEERREFKIGEVYLMEFTGSNNEQRGLRPGVVFQNNVGNAHSPNIVALPFTTSIKKVGQPTHVIIPSAGTGLLKDSMVLCENPAIISRERIGKYITTLSDYYMSKIAAANILASSAIQYLELSDIAKLKERAVLLNATTGVA